MKIFSRQFTSEDQVRDIPTWVVWTQCFCFFVLYSIWYYPSTNFLSDTLIIIGALLSLYILSLNISFFKSKESIPFWLLVILFIWVIFHLVFLSNHFSQQLRELESIWKRVLIAMVYGLGFGIGIVNFKSPSKCLILIYAGMIAPGLIYLFKFILGYYADHYSFILPDYIMLYDEPVSTYWIYKTAYTVALIPTFALGLASLQYSMLKKNNNFRNAISLFGILVAILVFDLVNIKNAVVYVAILTGILYINFVFKIFNKLQVPNAFKKIKISLLILFFVTIMTSLLINRSVEKNSSWNSFLLDIKVGQQVDIQEKWKEFGGNGFPLNEKQEVVSVTNYYRMAWLIIGTRLLIENPLGYGLVYRSFANLTLTKWPSSSLDQSHSGWLDLALGIGIPGFMLIIIAFLLTIYRLIKISNGEFSNKNQIFIAHALSWALLSISLVWATSEISQGINLVQLIFFISFGIGVAVKPVRSYLK
jgi:hypothetical protein